MNLARRPFRPGWWTMAAIALVLGLPLLVTPIPLLVDFPSHLSRFHVERHLGDSAALQLNFTYRWRYLPNLGVDLIVAALSRVITVEAAARLALTLIPVAGAAGMMLIARALHGRITLGTLLALPLNYAYPLIFGFVNSCLAVSLALLALGAWLSLADRPVARTAFQLVAAPVVLTAHIIGFGVLGLATAGMAIGRQWRRDARPVALVGATAAAALPLAWPLLMLLFWRTNGTSTNGHWFDWREIGMWLVTGLRDRFALVDVSSILLLYAFLLAPLVARRRFAIVGEAAAAAALLWLAVVLLPGRLFGSEFASVRLIPVALTFSLLAVGEREAPSPRLLAAGAAFAALRLALNATSLLDASNRAEQMLAPLPLIAPGSRVAAVELVDCARHWAPPRFYHVMSYATTRRDAFVNGQFVFAAGQALGLTPRIAPALADFATMAAAGDCPRLSPPEAVATQIKALPWRDVDLFWAIEAGATPTPLPVPARLIWQGGDGSRLYRITPPR